MKNRSPLSAVITTRKVSLALCTLGIIALGIASCIYQGIDKFSFGMGM